MDPEDGAELMDEDRGPVTADPMAQQEDQANSRSDDMAGGSSSSRATESATEAGRAKPWERVADLWERDPGRIAEVVVTVVVVAAATFVVLQTLQWRNLISDTTPTGGDMGAHVWGPHYLLHELLPRFRLSGWTMDWFNGFPAYQFYMVIPSLMIVYLHVGLHPVLAVLVVLAAVAAIAGTWAVPRLRARRTTVIVVAVAVALLAVPVHYNISFKLVSASGLIFLPLACWAMAKLADMPFPIPPFAAVASLFFIFNREPTYLNHGNIIGGNFTSTMAGEFAFSISLTLSILYLGVAARGLKTGKHRALSATLFALAGLCHLIPAFFVLACTGAMFLLHPDRPRLKWLSTMVPVAGLLTAFWVIPFWWRRDFVNDMGWEKLPEPAARWGSDIINPSGEPTSVWYYLVPPSGMRWIMAAAVIGVIFSFIRRYRVGMVLALAWAGVAVAFAFMPQYRLWNARLLPFQYVSVVLLAAVGVGEIVRIAGIVASGRVERPFRPITVGLGSLCSFVALVAVVLPLSGVLESDGPVGFERVTVPALVEKGGEVVQQDVTEARFKFLGFTYAIQPNMNPASGWARHNYTGLEEKPGSCSTAEDGTETCTGGWEEYRRFIGTMEALGEDPDHGCGSMMWEFDRDVINSYGTTMAPMLLPMFTDGCIASQEGLYFESTPSVPFHFYVQSELSTSGSRPQRNVTWPDFDMERGIGHLQLLGVRYYGASSEGAKSAADAAEDLTLVATAGRWNIYEVSDSPIVEALSFEPVVVDGIGESQHDWLPTASAWFQTSDLDVLMASDGPDSWARVEVEPVEEEMWRLTRWLNDQLGRYKIMDPAPEQPRSPLPEVTVTDIERGQDSISFKVSEPGVPVLVKTSYFPNWSVRGGEGPYRVAPNLMVVVPTDNDVSLHFDRTAPDVLAMGLTILGLVALWWLARQPDVEVSELTAGRTSAAIDRLLSLSPKQEGDSPPGQAEAGDQGWAQESSQDRPEDDWQGNTPAGSDIDTISHPKVETADLDDEEPGGDGGPP